MGKFDDLVSKLEKEKKDLEQQGLDNKIIKEKWLEELNDLYLNIKNWLKPLVDKKLIKIGDDMIEINNEPIGPYLAPSLRIITLKNTIHIQPIGTIIIGAKGRVDITSSKKNVMIVKHDDGWKIAQKIESGFNYKNFDKDSFAELIEELL